MVWPLVGAAISAAGAFARNRAQISSAREAQEFGAGMAREQMAFQERMSNTAYQRAAKDLEKAGLNRILAIGGPASTPGGASAPGVMPHLENVMKDAVNSATAVKMVNSQVQKMEEEVKQIRDQRALMNAQQNVQDAMSGKIHQESINLEETRKQIIASTSSTNQQIRAMEEYLKGLRLEGKMDESTFGTVMRYVRRFTGSLLGGTAKALPGVK